MKGSRLAIVGVVALLVGALVIVGIGTASAAGSGPQGWGPGSMMRGIAGMMGGSGRGMMGGAYGQRTPTQGQPIALDQAIKNVQSYVDQTGNKDLAIDEVMEFQDNFYAIVKEKSTGLGAFEVLVDKSTGSVYPEMGPNMMWNTKYGMHASGPSAAYGGGSGNGYGGMMGRGMMGGYGQSMMGGQYPVTAPTGPMTVNADQATKLAQQWLDQNQPGSTTEAPDQFYGYYTIHTLKDGKVSGMLSVNGYTGQVWYHTWHGAFVQSK